MTKPLFWRGVLEHSHTRAHRQVLIYWGSVWFTGPYVPGRAHSEFVGMRRHPPGFILLTPCFQPIFLNEVLVKLPTDPSGDEPIFHISHIDRVYTLRAESINER